MGILSCRIAGIGFGFVVVVGFVVGFVVGNCFRLCVGFGCRLGWIVRKCRIREGLQWDAAGVGGCWNCYGCPYHHCDGTYLARLARRRRFKEARWKGDGVGRALIVVLCGTGVVCRFGLI